MQGNMGKAPELVRRPKKEAEESIDHSFHWGFCVEGKFRIG